MILDKTAFGFRGFIIKRAFRAVFRRSDEKLVRRHILETLEDSCISVYIHFPFCRSLCPACPYVRYKYEERLVRKYIEAVKREISLYGKLLKEKNIKITDIHVGGGTPTLINPVQYERILDTLGTFFDFDKDLEYGIEANPNDLTESYLSELREAGVNQLSIGVQSFDDGNLKLLGRIHRSKDNIAAIERALSVNFKHVNIDMMYFLPNQSLDNWTADIEKATDFKVNQVTLYPLLIVHYRPMYKLMRGGKIPEQPKRKLFNLMYGKALQVLKRGGFHPIRYYSFSRTGTEYSTVEREMVGPLIAFGSGGMGFTGGCEYVNTCFPWEYISALANNKLPVAGARRVSKEERAVRYVLERLGALRLSFQEFRKMFNEDFHSLIGRTGLKYFLFLDRLLGNIKVSSSGIELTEKGMYTRNWSGWAFVLMVPCGVVEKYLVKPWPEEVSVP